MLGRAGKGLCALALLMTLGGCLRYVPAHDGEEKKYFAGKEAFIAFEDNQRKRLNDLLQARSTLASGPGADSYFLGEGDVFDLSVFEVPELNTTVRVRPTGDISLPLIGTVAVAGKSEGEVQDLLHERLSKFVRHPQVRIFIKEYNSHRVSVIGEVSKPGVYPLQRRNYSLVELISSAGGKTERASGRLVLIPAQTATTSQQANGIEIFFDDLIGSSEKPPLIVPLVANDTVLIPESGSVQVDGEVLKPGSVPLSSRMTLLGSIAASGGLTYSADVSRVELIRELGGGTKAIMPVDLEAIALRGEKDLRLRDGDVVRVPSEPSRFATRQVVESINKLFSFSSQVR